MDNDYKTDLTALVDRIRPSRLLCIGPEGALFAPYCEAHAKCHLTHLDTLTPLNQLPADARFDFAYLSRTLERLPRRDGERLLARLRDLHTPRFALLLPLDGDGGEGRWEESALFAFGLTRLGRYREAGKRLGLYGFDLDRYKTTPDWLNPRFWANPERWDKAWW